MAYTDTPTHAHYFESLYVLSDFNKPAANFLLVQLLYSQQQRSTQNNNFERERERTSEKGKTNMRPHAILVVWETFIMYAYACVYVNAIIIRVCYAVFFISFFFFSLILSFRFLYLTNKSIILFIQLSGSFQKSKLLPRFCLILAAGEEEKEEVKEITGEMNGEYFW